MSASPLDDLSLQNGITVNGDQFFPGSKKYRVSKDGLDNKSEEDDIDSIEPVEKPDAESD